MATVKGPPQGPGSQGPKVPTTARNAAGKQAKETPKGQYQRPHRVHTEEEERISELRHHQAVVEEEAHNRHVREVDANSNLREEDVEEDLYRVEGFTFDDRKKKGKKREDDEDEDEDGEAASEAAQAAMKQGFVEQDGAGRYFQDMPIDRLGDPSLLNPNEMKRVLGATSRFAQHAMLLSQAKIEEGLGRGDAIAFLARFYIDLGDREYAKKALREFGPGTGILDIYPLEVVEHLLQFVPSFFTTIHKGRFFTSSTNSHYRAKAGEIISLSYPPELKIRGFALKGGDRPGYLLEPTEPPGTYSLTFQTGGTFRILVSAIGRSGQVLIEEMVCEIEASEATTFDEAAAVKRERASQIEEPKPAKEKKDEPMDADLRIHLKQRI